MHRIILTYALWALHLIAFCKIITPEQASQVARNFYFERINIERTVSQDEISISNVQSLGKNTVSCYICNMEPEGFVVVSASDKVMPVLGYSFESRYDESLVIPDGFKAWSDYYIQQIEFAETNSLVPTEATKNEWQRLLTSNFSRNTGLRTMQSVAPLLVSKWNQDSPYNLWCPADPAGPGGRCYAGCVATAMGQLLYYYRFPQQGQGSYTYTHPDYGTISADFGATMYHWEGMPSSINKNNDAIGELLFHQGVSVDMDYGPDGSGMWNHKAAYSLKTYFRYGPETQYYFRDSVTIDWDSLLITNLNQRKPLYYAGWAGVQSTEGHAFVCDGYQPGNYYHFNWGWGGSQDGYFYTNNLTPGGNNFNFAQEVIPCFPDTIQNIYPTYCQGLTTLTGLRGSIEDGSGWYNYQNNSSCSWLIAPQDMEYDSVKNIKMTFLKFDTETGADTLFVYDGTDSSAPLLGSFSGNSIPGTLVSTGNKVFLKFKSNASITGEGWQIDYESNFPVYCSGITTLTASSGSIEDGSGDKKYSNNSMCRWKIMPTDGVPITFYFNSFETFDSTDIVKIYDLQTQEVLGTFSGNQLPPPVTANSGKMMILFMTNGSGNALGWSGNYLASGVGIGETDSCFHNTIVYPNPGAGLFWIEKYVPNGAEHKLKIDVYDLMGVKVYDNSVNVVAGINTLKIDLSRLPVAPYFIVLEEGSQKEVLKITLKK